MDNQSDDLPDDQPPPYTVGYRKPPLHSQFRKGRSGNPAGGRRRKVLAELLEEALDRKVAQGGQRRRRPATRREAIVAALVEQAAAGDLRATKLLLDLLDKIGLAALPAPGRCGDDEDPREFLIREVDRLAAEQAAEEARAAAAADASAPPEQA